MSNVVSKRRLKSELDRDCYTLTLLVTKMVFYGDTTGELNSWTCQLASLISSDNKMMVEPGGKKLSLKAYKKHLFYYFDGTYEKTWRAIDLLHKSSDCKVFNDAHYERVVTLKSLGEDITNEFAIVLSCKNSWSFDIILNQIQCLLREYKILKDEEKKPLPVNCDDFFPEEGEDD